MNLRRFKVHRVQSFHLIQLAERMVEYVLEGKLLVLYPSLGQFKTR